MSLLYERTYGKPEKPISKVNLHPYILLICADNDKSWNFTKSVLSTYKSVTKFIQELTKSNIMYGQVHITNLVNLHLVINSKSEKF